MSTVARKVVRHNSSADRLHDLLMDLVRVAGLLATDEPVHGHPISLSQAFALHDLDTDPPLSQRDLAARLRLEKSTVSRLAADLERDGLLVRERDPADRRSYRLRLTARGRALHERLRSAFHRRYECWIDELSADEQQALLHGLPALIRVIRGASPAPGDEPSHTPHVAGPR
jgi:DNA-binding MarR family transcriptional regulator